jgi:hypothetical protein
MMILSVESLKLFLTYKSLEKEFYMDVQTVDGNVSHTEGVTLQGSGINHTPTKQLLDQLLSGARTLHVLQTQDKARKVFSPRGVLGQSVTTLTRS